MSYESVLPQDVIDEFYKQINSTEKKPKEIVKAKHKPNPVRSSYSVERRRSMYMECPVCRKGVSEISLLFTQNKSPLHIGHCNYCDETVSVSKEILSGLKRKNKTKN